MIAGGLEQPARQLLPLEPVSWDGGRVSFTMKVDPVQPNYFTVKLWGSDAGLDRGRLRCSARESKSVFVTLVTSNPRHPLEFPRNPNRFTYITTVLPKAMTAGKTSVPLEIRSLGRIWGYGETWDKFQKNMAEPSRGVYAAYTHTDPFFAPSADEKQGEPIANPTVRTSPGPEVLDDLKARVNREVTKLLAAR